MHFNPEASTVDIFYILTTLITGSYQAVKKFSVKKNKKNKNVSMFLGKKINLIPKVVVSTKAKRLLIFMGARVCAQCVLCRIDHYSYCMRGD